MTIPFASTLRARPGVLTVGAARAGQATWSIRAEVPEVWDVVRLAASPSTSVADMKRVALGALYPAGTPDQFVTKLNGIEVLDEAASLQESGASDGSTFLLMFRHRRPVR
jgi:hypothetical protein